MVNQKSENDITEIIIISIIVNNNRYINLMKRIKWAISLPIVAVILLIIEFWMEFFCRDISWDQSLHMIKRVNWIDLLIFPAMIVIGIIIGILPLSKQKFATRASISTALIFIGFSLFFIIRMTISAYGLDSTINYFTAKEDIRNGKIRFYTYGQLCCIPSNVYRAIDSLGKSYGYETINIGMGTPGVEIYNDVVEDYLEQIHGENWRNEFYRKVDSIHGVETQIKKD
ncbi:MAG: hypothetical protein LBV59_24150 [Sphingobacterium sp.]|jgi:hypothetical protein|uniref:FEKKY domain-containing protein n=1 Tax=Sphingobacterium sp. TaxID=341027 RepID=UPI00283C028C|nr:hypothetical protein [Sphingobacterium sp.]MDR3011040.1 hypothetical protein [Sphingobacterium sp.]